MFTAKISWKSLSEMDNEIAGLEAGLEQLNKYMTDYFPEA